MAEKPERGYFQIEFGVMAPRLHEQAAVPEHEVEKEQKLADALDILRIHGYIADNVSERGRKKIVKAVGKLLNEKYGGRPPAERAAELAAATAGDPPIDLTEDAEPIAEQAGLADSDVEWEQKIADALNRLYFGGFITAEVVEKGRKRIAGNVRKLMAEEAEGAAEA